MSSDCGICLSTPSKYKCPTCAIKYCSLVCYKTHKPIHADERPVQTAATPLTRTSVVETATPDPAPPARRRLGPKKTDFSDFETNAVLIDLLRKYPTLRLELQSVYGLMLEPASSGRGRGGNWTQAKGEAEALERLSRLRNQEGENGGVAEFIRLVELQFGDDKQS